MNIKTKLIVLFMYVAVVPMILLGTALYVTSDKAIKNNITNHLTAIASLQHDRIQELISKKKEMIEFVAKQSDVVEAIQNKNSNMSTSVLRNIASLNDSTEFAAIFMNDSTLLSMVPNTFFDYEHSVAMHTSIRDGLWYTNVSVIKDKDDHLLLVLSTPIKIDDNVVGTLLIAEHMGDIAKIAQSYGGMRDTGETIIASVGTDNAIQYLHKKRFEHQMIPNVEPSRHVIYQALLRDSGNYTDYIDYRGENVFASSRYFHEAGWVILVKIDRSEALFISMILVNIIMSILPGLLLISILMALRFGNSVANPIVKLSKASTALIEGYEEEDDDILLSGNDEVAQLCKDFQKMRGTVRMNQKMLQSMVNDKTKKLSGKITELEKANDIIEKVSGDREKFQLAVDSSSDAILFSKPDHTILYVNAMWAKLTGYSQEEIENKDVFYWCGNDTDSTIINQIKQALESGDTYHTRDIRMGKKDGSTYEAELTIYTVIDPESKSPLYCVLLHRDVSDEKRLEKAKSEFLSLASHELGTPISKISWTFEVLMDSFKKLSETQKNLIDTAYECLQQMSKSINRMLLVSRIESKAVHTNEGVCDLRKLLQEIENTYKESYTEKSISMSVDCPKNILLHLDPHLLQEVLSNIVKNAILYTPENGKVALKAKTNKDKISIFIQDTGIGIPYHEQSRIFSKLFRAKNAMTVDTDGAGLGLYVSRSLAEILGGTISFTSEEEKGSEFVVEFPATLLVKEEKHPA